jgi:hypothetical protein
MRNSYDLFEKFPDGSSLWRACVIGLQGTRLYMSDLAQRSPNHFYALHIVSGKMVPLDLHPDALGAAQKAGKRSKSAVA